MARYIDADAFKQKLADKDIFFPALFKNELDEMPTADVVPKSEVVKVLDEIEKTIRGALVLIGFSYKHNPKEIQCKQECYEDFLGYIAELKKKYTKENKDEN